MDLIPEKQLKLYLLQMGYPAKDLPLILRYCPNLITKFSIEEIALLGLTNIKEFRPEKKSIIIRPFVYKAMLQETGGRDISSFIEEAIALFSQDSFEHVAASMLEEVKSKLGESNDYSRISKVYSGK